MEVDTVGAAVDLRGAELDERSQARLDVGGLQIGIDALQGLDTFGRDLEILDAAGHG